MILADLRRVLEAAVADTPADRLGDLAGALEATRLAVWARMTTSPPPPPIARLVTADELEAAHQVPASWFMTAARDGSIPCVRHRHHVRFEAEAVRRALEAQPVLRRRGRRVDDHKMRSPARAEKPSNGVGPLPDCYRAAGENSPGNTWK